VIFRHLRREPAVRSLVWFLPIALVGGLWLWGVSRRAAGGLDAVPFRDHPDGLYPSLIVVWSVLFGFLLAAGVIQRASSRFDLTLPISGRRLWLTHVGATITSGMAILATMAGVLTLGNLIEGRTPLLDPGILSLALALGCGLVLTVTLMQSFQPRLFSAPRRVGNILFEILSMAAYLALVIALSALPPACALIPLAVALGLGARTCLLVPKSLTVTPATPRVEATAPRAALNGASFGDLIRARPSRRGWMLPSTIWRSSLGNPTLIYLAAAVFYGFLLSWPYYELRIPLVFLTLIILSSWTVVSFRGVPSLDVLPISRRRVFAIFVVPTLLLITLGYAAGSTTWTMVRGPASPVALELCCDRYEVRVPNEFHDLLRGRTPFRIDSPWGESHYVAGTPLFPGGAIRVINPFSTPTGSSPEFIALQLERAVKAVTGVTLPAADIRDRYLEPQPDGSVKPRASRFLLTDDHPDVTKRSRGQVFPALLALVAVPWLLFAALVCRLSRVVDARRIARTLAVFFFTPIVVFGVGTIAAGAVGLLDLTVLTFVFEIAIRSFVDLLPGGPIVFWLLSLLLTGGGYIIAMKQFENLEARPCVETP
jgi:hypothetical protein